MSNNKINNTDEELQLNQQNLKISKDNLNKAINDDKKNENDAKYKDFLEYLRRKQTSKNNSKNGSTLRLINNNTDVNKNKNSVKIDEENITSPNNSNLGLLGTLNKKIIADNEDSPISLDNLVTYEPRVNKPIYKKELNKSGLVIENVVNELIVSSNSHYNKSIKNNNSPKTNNKILQNRKIECWNCHFIIITKPDWERVQCTHCGEINALPPIDPEEYDEYEQDVNTVEIVNEPEETKYKEFIDIICPFCQYHMRTKSDSRYLICTKCHNTILIAKHPHSLPQYINNIYNPYKDPEGVLSNAKTVLVKNITNPLNRTTGLLENIFNPLVDPYAIEKEFERFLRIVANREFDTWKNKLKLKESQLTTNYFEGSNKYNVLKPLLDLDTEKGNNRYTNQLSNISYERDPILKKTGYIISNNSSFIPAGKEYYFQDKYNNPYKDNKLDIDKNALEKKLLTKLGNSNNYFNNFLNEKNKFNIESTNKYIRNPVSLPNLTRNNYKK